MELEKLISLLNGVLGSLTDERMAAFEVCTTLTDVLKFMAEPGVKLPDELLEAVA